MILQHNGARVLQQWCSNTLVWLARKVSCPKARVRKVLQPQPVTRDRVQSMDMGSRATGRDGSHNQSQQGQSLFG